MLPLTYGADVLHGAVHGGHIMPFYLDFAVLGAFCAGKIAAQVATIRYFLAEVTVKKYLRKN